MTDCQFLGTLVDNMQKNIKKDSKNFQRQRLTNDHTMESQES